VKIITIFCILFCIYIPAQEQSVPTTELNELLMVEKNGRAKIESEKVAVFPLGMTVLKKMIVENFRMRKIISNAETETCQINFVVDKEGSIVDVKASGSNESFNREAERAILKIKEKWIPGELNGEKVRCRFRIPLTISSIKK
jgi:protein TonB